MEIDKRIEQALLLFKGYDESDYPNFVKHEGFAIINPKAFSIFLAKSDAENWQARALRAEMKLQTIKSIVK